MSMAVNLVLTGELEQLVRQRIKSGYATSKAEVVRMGLTKLKKDDQFEDISDDPELYDYLIKRKKGLIKPKIVGGYKELKEILTRP